MNILGLILIFMHILLCIISYIGFHFKLIKLKKYMFLYVLFLPFFGFMTVFFLNLNVLFKKDESIDIDIHKMELESVLYKGITIDESDNDDELVSIEEALIINSAKERRELIMDVLNDNPKEYVEFLKKAGNNEDPEVVHYAVTAMVEISKENDYTLQKLSREYSKNPDDISVLTEYCGFLWTVLEQKLLTGQVEIMNRNLFSQLISKKLENVESLEDYIRYAENEISLENYTKAGEILDKAEKKYADTEELILIKFKYYSLLKRGDKIKEMISDLQKRRVFVSGKVKEAIAFWKA